MRPDSIMTLPRSMRLIVPVTSCSSRSRKVAQDLLALGVTDFLQDHLLGGLRADAAEIDRLQRLLDNVTELQVFAAFGRIGNGDLACRLFMLLVGHDHPLADIALYSPVGDRSRRAHRLLPGEIYR